MVLEPAGAVASCLGWRAPKSAAFAPKETGFSPEQGQAVWFQGLEVVPKSPASSGVLQTIGNKLCLLHFGKHLKMCRIKM